MMAALLAKWGNGVVLAGTKQRFIRFTKAEIPPQASLAPTAALQTPIQENG
jgi:hypothetical protein